MVTVREVCPAAKVTVPEVPWYPVPATAVPSTVVKPTVAADAVPAVRVRVRTTEVAPGPP